jgi:hypothetical protein
VSGWRASHRAGSVRPGEAPAAPFNALHRAVCSPPREALQSRAMSRLCVLIMDEADAWGRPRLTRRAPRHRGTGPRTG